MNGRTVRVDDIRDEMEGQQLRALLKEMDIPHYIHSYHDSAYDGLFQLQLGWGYVEAPEEYKDRVEEALNTIRAAHPQVPEDDSLFRN